MICKTQLRINLQKLADNVSKLKKISPKNKILFMVKANAYGHGLAQIVRYCIEELQIKEFGVAQIREAKLLRESLKDHFFEIYVFSDLELNIKASCELYLKQRILPVLSSKDDLDFILANNEFKHIPLCLKFNTGMNRLGITKDEVDYVIAQLKKHDRKEVSHLMSHFACASSSIRKNERSTQQYSLFKEIKSEFQNSGISILDTSMANSGAIEQGISLEETYIRPGLMLYGPTSLNKEDRVAATWDGENISSLQTHIIKIQKVKKGDAIGYGATACPRDGVMVIVPIGYGDGLSTHFQGVKLKHKGFVGEVIGKVNMDMTAILFENEAEKAIKPFDQFVFWDNNTENILSVSDQMDTIPYEIFCHISIRVPRIYSLK